MYKKKEFRSMMWIIVSASLMFLGACKNNKSLNAKSQEIVIKTDYSQLKIGDYYYNDGTFSTGLDSTKTCIGIVFSLKTTDAEKKHGWTHGQIVALANAGNGEDSEWSLSAKNLSDPFGQYSWKKWSVARAVMNGFECTHAESVVSSVYKAFDAARKYRMALPTGRTSGWYLPSVGQWADIIQNLGKVSFKSDGSFDPNLAMDHMKTLGFNKAFYWTSTQVDKDMSWYVDLVNGALSGDSKDTRNKVRTVAAI